MSSMKERVVGRAVQSVGQLVRVSVCSSVCRTVNQSVGQFVSQLVNQSNSYSVPVSLFTVSPSITRFRMSFTHLEVVSQSVSQSASQAVNQSVSHCLVSLSVSQCPNIAGTGACSQHECHSNSICVERNGLATCECPSCQDELKEVTITTAVIIITLHECEFSFPVFLPQIMRACKILSHSPSFLDGHFCYLKPLYLISEKFSLKLFTYIKIQVCGSDSITYQNLCRLKQTACRKRSNTYAKYEGLCGQSR